MFAPPAASRRSYVSHEPKYINNDWQEANGKLKAKRSQAVGPSDQSLRQNDLKRLVW